METTKTATDKLDERFQNTGTERDMIEKGAILQRDGTYAIAPHIPGGVITDFNLLRKLADVADKYKCAALKVTSSQRIALVGLKKEDVDNAWRDLNITPGAAIGLCVRSVKFCPGITFCKRGQQDSIALGGAIDKKYHGMTLPSKFKIGVSGCPNKCMDSTMIDFGAVGTAKGFIIFAGGNGGINPRFGQKIAEHQTHEQVLNMLDNIVLLYEKEARTNERLGSFIERIGFESFKEKVIKIKLH